MATGKPMARRTGSVDVASNANTMKVDTEHVRTAWSVRTCSSRSSGRVLEEQRVVQPETRDQNQRDQVKQRQRVPER